MLVGNDRNAENRGGWLGVDVHQTLVFENVTLYLATGLALPSVPRIGEALEVYSNYFAGTVKNVTYQAHYNTYYRDNPDKPILDPENLPPFNECTIKIELAKRVFEESILSYTIQEEFIDCSYKIMASRKERPEDFRERQKLRNDPDYRLHFLRDVYSNDNTQFDVEAFDKAFPEVF